MSRTSAGVAIIGHRGCAAEAPENTLASVRRAWEQGADGVEIDVFLSRDGVIVAHHDETTKRTAGVDRTIADQTLAELKGLDVGRWKGPAFAGERIPTLPEVLATIPAGRRLFIEVKCGDEFVPAFERVLAESKTPASQIVIISFDAGVVKRMKEAMPAFEAAWIVEIERDDAGGWKPDLGDILEDARRIGADGVDLGNAPPLTRADVALFHDSGLKVYIWTANEIVRARELREAGVDGLTTDRPGSLRRELESVAADSNR